MGVKDEIYNYYYNRINALLRKLARTAKSKNDICSELRVIRSAISALGGNQMPPETKKELLELIDEALRLGGCPQGR